MELNAEEVANTDDELEQEKSVQERDMKSLSAKENADERESLKDDGQDEVAADSEDEEPELMEQDEDELELCTKKWSRELRVIGLETKLVLMLYQHWETWSVVLSMLSSAQKQRVLGMSI